MTHLHEVHDSDFHFKIDPITRAISKLATNKNSIVQFDHNSERFTFELPKTVEGHDMTTCNRIEIHYTNFDTRRKATSKGFYTVTDLKESADDADVLEFSWLLSQNTAMYEGTLEFCIKFMCQTGSVDYAWNTAIFKDFRVVAGMDNSGAVLDEYHDGLTEWKNDIMKEVAALSAEVAELDKRVTALEPKTISVDLSQISYNEGAVDMGAYRNYVIIDGAKTVLDPNSTLGVRNDVTSLIIGIDGTNGENSVSYSMGGTTYTLTHGSESPDGNYSWAEEHEIELTDSVVIVASNEKYCLTGDTLITMADGTYKRIDEIEVGDSVRAIDPETLEVVADTVTYSDAGTDKTADHYDVWTFSDGTIIKTVARHRFYNIERKAMVYMDEWNIGEHAYNEKGESVALVSHERVNETVNFYTIFTEKNNYFANGLLSGNRRTKTILL